jgi:hypothetical protein
MTESEIKEQSGRDPLLGTSMYLYACTLYLCMSVCMYVRIGTWVYTSLCMCKCYCIYDRIRNEGRI